MLKLLPLFALAYGLLTVIVTASLYRALRCPPRFTYAAALGRGFPTEPGELGLKSEQIALRDAKGFDTSAWSITGNNPCGPIVLMLHGFSRSRYSSLELAPCFVDHAAQLVLPDLPGHGESAAKATAAGVTEWNDVLAFVEQVRDGERPVVLYGRSMGAGICIAAAAHGGDAITGVIAEGAYRDWSGPIRRRLKLRRYPAEPYVTLAGWMYRLLVAGLGDFDRVALAQEVACPMLLMHGTNDAVCPIDDARAIADAASNAELVEFTDGQHLDLHRIDPEKHRAAIAHFFANVSPAPEDHKPRGKETTCLTNP